MISPNVLRLAYGYGEAQAGRFIGALGDSHGRVHGYKGFWL